MIDRQTIQNAIDTLTATTLNASPAIPFLYGNQVNVAISEGTKSWVKQTVYFTEDRQAELGNDCFRRQRGYVLFLIYVKRGLGNYDRNTITDRLTRAFRSRYVGQATMLDAQMIPSSETENWSVTGVQIPFYFDNPED